MQKHPGRNKSSLGSCRCGIEYILTYLTYLLTYLTYLLTYLLTYPYP